MKRILFALVAVAGLAVGCVNEVEDLFDKPASERLQAQMVECQKLLTSAQNGWMIAYYPDGEKSFGGTIFTAKFDSDGSVTMTGEVAAQSDMGGDVTKVITSNYSIKSSTGVVLTFDTYNKYLHYWSDPDFTGGNDFGGEFEFAFVGGDKNEMVFRGIKTGNRVVFTALENDIVTSIQSVLDIRDAVVGQLYAGFKLAGSQVVPVSPAAAGVRADGEEGGEIDTTPTLYADDAYNLLIYYPTGNLDGEYIYIPYAYDQEGITLYEPTEVAGVMLHRLKWDAENEILVAVDATTPDGKATDATMTGYHGEGFMHYDEFLGSYTLKYSSSRTVTLTEKIRYQSYEMNLYSTLKAEVQYSKADGSLTLKAQYLGPYKYLNTMYDAWLWAWSAAGGGWITYSSTVGMKLVHNGDPDNLVLTFQDFGSWSYPVDGFIIYRQTPGTTTRVGAVLQLGSVQTMTKK